MWSLHHVHQAAVLELELAEPLAVVLQLLATENQAHQVERLVHVLGHQFAEGAECRVGVGLHRELGLGLHHLHLHRHRVALGAGAVATDGEATAGRHCGLELVQEELYHGEVRSRRKHLDHDETTHLEQLQRPRHLQTRRGVVGGGLQHQVSLAELAHTRVQELLALVHGGERQVGRELWTSHQISQSETPCRQAKSSLRAKQASKQNVEVQLDQEADGLGANVC